MVITRMYRVVGMIWGHLIFQNTWSSVAPSTSAASIMEVSTLPRAATYSTMGWPMEVVKRIRMIHQMAKRSSPSQAMSVPRT